MGHLAKITKMRYTNVLKNFKCTKPEFAEYLSVIAPYDQNERMGQTYLCRYNRQIVGYLVIAAAHLDKTSQQKLNIDTYGNIPVLQITHLATHKDYERTGIGSMMVYWAIDYAISLSSKMGCRAVLANSKRDVVGFYRKLGFKRTLAPRSNEIAMHFDIGSASSAPPSRPLESFKRWMKTGPKPPRPTLSVGSERPDCTLWRSWS